MPANAVSSAEWGGHPETSADARSARYSTAARSSVAESSGDSLDVADGSGHRRAKSAVLDSAYEEYCHRLDAGEKVDVQQFVRRFPGYQTSLLRQIEAHEWLAAHCELLEVPVAWPLPGEDFLGFHLLEELGRGAFSRVFLAEELALGERSVVVKVSRLSGMEPQALGRLRHPHIVPVHSVQFDDRSGLSAICMPFCGRATLYDLLDQAFREGTIPRHGRVVEEAIGRAATPDDPADEAPRKAARHWWNTSYVNAIVRLGLQLLGALEFAHRAGVFHCDIKPSNVLLCRSGVKLFDFNLALSDDADGRRGGTLPYMAPEQLHAIAGKVDRATPGGPAVRIDARTDLFSLGVLLYELLSGQLPWGPLPAHLPLERAAEELLARHARGPRPLRAVAPALNPRLARVIESSLAVRPCDRPAAADELSASLRRELRCAPRGARFAREHRRAVLASLGGALLVAGAGAGYWAIAEPSSVRHLRLGKEAFRAEDYARAAECFEVVLGTEPENHHARFLKAVAHLRWQDYASAEAELKALNAQLTSNSYVLVCLGHCVAAKATQPQDFAVAYGFLRRAEGRFAESAAYWNNVGYCKAELEEWKRAIAWLRKATTLEPEEAVIHSNLAWACIKAAGVEVGAADLLELRWQAATHIELALRHAPLVADYQIEWVTIHVATLRSQHGDLSPAERQVIMDGIMWHCEQAIALGGSKGELREALAPLPELSSDPRFARLPDGSARSPRSSPAARLLDSLRGIDPMSLDL